MRITASIRAPISGRIGRSIYSTGALVTASQADALTTISRLDPIYVDIQQSIADLLTLRQQILSGQVASDGKAKVQLFGSGPILNEALRAQAILAEKYGVAADVWSVTSWTELRRDALACESHNMLHPGEETRVPYVTTALSGEPGPVVAVSDWMRSVPDQISRWVPASAYTSLGTDGFGFSDTRPAARRFFNVDAESIVLAVLSQLAKTGEVDPSLPSQAITKYKLDLPVEEALG